MAIFTVTTTADRVDAGDDELSLREAVAQANATASADTIRFAAAVEGRALTLTGGQLELRADVAIDGDRDDDGERVTVSGGGESRVLLIRGDGTDADIRDLAVTGGQTDGSGDGGGILLGAGNSLDLVNVRVAGNNAAGDFGGRSGGGIFAEEGSRLSLTGSRVTDNTASYGGGIAAAAGASVDAERSVFRGNYAFERGGAIAGFEDSALGLSRSLVTRNGGGGLYGGHGGGLSVEGASALIEASTLSLNSSGGAGGGISVTGGGRLAIDRSTIAFNSASFLDGGGAGGGIQLEVGRVDIANSTVTGNQAGVGTYGSGGGISVFGDYNNTSGARLAIANTIVAGNVAGDIDSLDPVQDDVSGPIAVSNGHNLFGTAVDGDADGDLEGVDPTSIFASTNPFTNGGNLAFNGGPTQTAALRDALDNPALSGADPVAAGEVDQRGAARPQPAQSNPDIGAFELDQNAISSSPSARNDVVSGTAAANALAGRAGADLLRGLGGNDGLDGGDGGDVVEGGLGNDRLNGGMGRDTASYRDAGGAVVASLAEQASTGAQGSDTLLRLENLEGGRFADRLTGDALTNVLDGGDGVDRLFGLKGADALTGGSGGDRLAGGAGGDLLLGGSGGDLFDYDALVDSRPGAGADLVLDFGSGGDRFDLATIDASVAAPGNNAFSFLAREGATFSGAGQVRWFQDLGDTFVEASTDADRAAELQIRIAGFEDLAGGDFVL